MGVGVDGGPVWDRDEEDGGGEAVAAVSDEAAGDFDGRSQHSDRRSRDEEHLILAVLRSGGGVRIFGHYFLVFEHFNFVEYSNMCVCVYIYKIIGW